MQHRLQFLSMCSLSASSDSFLLLNTSLIGFFLCGTLTGKQTRRKTSLVGKEQGMKPSPPIIPADTKLTFVDVWRWGQELERFHARIAPRFARPEPRRRALAYLKGIVSATPRKNGWQLAEHAGEARPDGMQPLLNSAVWDADLVRDESLVPTSWSVWVIRRRSW